MTNEKRLIDANALVENADVFTMHTKEYGSIEVIPVDAIGDAPTVDAVEVVHGRWEKDPDMRRINGHIYDYRCSHCHSPAEKGCYNNNDRFTNYCPNCGAKMDGDGNA